MRVTSQNSIAAYQSIDRTQRSLSQSLERLGSGVRINRGADDAAGLAVSEGLRGQIRGLNAASGNVQDGISLLNVAEGGLSGISDTLNRVRELTIQAGNGAYGEDEIRALEDEARQLLASIDDSAGRTQFNTRNLLDGSSSGKVTSANSEVQGYIRGPLPVTGSFSGRIVESTDEDGETVREVELRDAGGRSFRASLDSGGRARGVLPGLDLDLGALAEGDAANSDFTVNVSRSELNFQDGANQGQSSRFSFGDYRSGALGLDSVDFSSEESRNAFLGRVDRAVNDVSSARASIGAQTNQYESRYERLGSQRTELSRSESLIRDTDYAQESVNSTRSLMMLKTGLAMMAQGQVSSRAVLQLLGR